MKFYKILYVLIFISVTSNAQELGNFSGGFESNSQWLQDDSELGVLAPDDQFRSNNYFLLNYEVGKFTAGIQYEAYLPTPLLGYDPVLEGNGVANYYLNFEHESLDITAGYFYEQFGNGLILRSWEDRQLGVNTALKGARVKFSPTDFWDLTAVYGEQRVGFETSDGVVQGLDTNIDVGQLLDVDNLFLDLGGSYVGRYQDNMGNAKVPTTVNAYSGRVDLFYKTFYANFEAVHKEPDVLVNEGQITNNANVYKGNALLLTLGYAQSGLGINGTVRRMENFSFYSDRLAEGNQFNQQRINFVPALTKQHDYLLSNIYVYNPQSRLLILDFQQQAGEMGGQFDIYYTLEKGTALGGKYGTKLSGNFAYWGGLDAEFDVETDSYSSEFIGSGGDRYFREATLEIKKRWTKELSAIYYYTNSIIDKGITDGSPLGFTDIKSNVAVAEHTYRLGGGKSARLELQHLWTKQDRKNWAAAVAEYNFSSSFGLYVADSWNYGGEGKIHYYNVGGSYTEGRTRVALNYGRQRGGLICVGGVCRFVPENTGLTLNITTTF
ncbi:DUF6029 family protein [Mesonia aquimarina]|uniref:DUF6029 family protein n=1 Tax=Mesonia aquimarina TaxID=1504967 RepID=UPI000EF62F8F|nr:DUF6029 family protein [Mesonia aquimarina]